MLSVYDILAKQVLSWIWIEMQFTVFVIQVILSQRWFWHVVSEMLSWHVHNLAVIQILFDNRHVIYHNSEWVGLVKRSSGGWCPRTILCIPSSLHILPRYMQETATDWIMMIIFPKSIVISTMCNLHVRHPYYPNVLNKWNCITARTADLNQVGMTLACISRVFFNSTEFCDQHPYSVPKRYFGRVNYMPVVFIIIDQTDIVYIRLNYMIHIGPFY